MRNQRSEARKGAKNPKKGGGRNGETAEKKKKCGLAASQISQSASDEGAGKLTTNACTVRLRERTLKKWGWEKITTSAKEYGGRRDRES